MKKEMERFDIGIDSVGSYYHGSEKFMYFHFISGL